MKLIRGMNDLATVKPEVAGEWDYEANGELKPSDVTVNSNRVISWKCEKGHVWKASVANRAKGSKCPYCAGKLAIKGKTDLATVNPGLAKEWDYEANGELKPSDVTANSGKKVGWKCRNGHRWKASVTNRTNGRMCPYCAGKLVIKGATDLATINPELAKEWDYEENGRIKPDEVTANSGKKVRWKCEKGHEWLASIASRNNGTGCPYCTGRLAIKGETDLLSVNPDLVKEWDYEENRRIKPDEVTANSMKKVSWKCEKGHKWSAIINNRTKGSGCPYCKGKLAIKGITDLATINPGLAKEWDYEGNGDLKPMDVTANSNRKIGWKCSKGHRWIASVISRTKGSGCPICGRL